MTTTTIKQLLIVILAIGMMSCGNDQTTAQPSESAADTPQEMVDNNQIEEPESIVNTGKNVYDKTCKVCHQEDGKGIVDAFPPLAGSDYLMEDKTRAISQVMYGSEGEITVNGNVYNGMMPAQVLTDEEITDVINYILNSWGNDGGQVSIEEVHALRLKGAE